MNKIIKVLACLILLSMMTLGTCAQNVQKGTQMPVKERRAYEKRAWKHMGGLYTFVGGKSGIVGFNAGVGDESQYLSIDGEELPATVNPKTGRITAFDKKGNLVFDGYLTNGGNRLEGRYRGRKVKYEGACGL